MNSFFRPAGLAFFLLACFGFCCVVQADSRFDAKTLARIDALVSSKVTWTGETPAYSILIDQGGKIVYERNIGFADIGNQVPATRNTVYKIGSITKSYTALAILQLEEKGQLDLDATVADYLTDFAGPAGVVTIRELLTHTSGIPNYTALPEAWSVLTSPSVTRDGVVGMFAGKALEFEPGSTFSYSNSGYYLLGLIIEAVSGQGYFDYLKENVFVPLGLEATYVGGFEEIVPHQAKGYTVTQKGFANAAPTPQLAPFSAGILEASTTDLIKFRRAIVHSDLISEKLKAMIMTTGLFPGGTKQRYALGALTISDFYGYRKWSHSGGISGFSSHFDYFPEKDITVVVLVNANGEPISPRNLAIKIAREIFAIPQPSEILIEVSQEQLVSYSGKYQTSPFRLIGEFIRFQVEEGILQLQVNDDDENPVLIPLLARSENEFVLAADDELRFRFISESGKAKGLEVHNSDGMISGVFSPAL